MKEEDENANGVAEVMKEISEKYTVLLKYVAKKNINQRCGLSNEDALHECIVQRLLFLENTKFIWTAIDYCLRDLQRDNFNYRRKNKIEVISFDQIRDRFDRENHFRDGLACEDESLKSLEDKDFIDFIIQEGNLTQLEKEIMYLRFYRDLGWQEVSKILALDCPSLGSSDIKNSKVFYHYRNALEKLRRVVKILRVEK